MNNWHDLIDTAAGRRDGNETDRVLDTAVPWLCPRCEGTGTVCGNSPATFLTPRRCDHRDAPTIADILDLGATKHRQQAALSNLVKISEEVGMYEQQTGR